MATPVPQSHGGRRSIVPKIHGAERPKEKFVLVTMELLWKGQVWVCVQLPPQKGGGRRAFWRGWGRGRGGGTLRWPGLHVTPPSCGGVGGLLNGWPPNTAMHQKSARPWLGAACRAHTGGQSISGPWWGEDVLSYGAL